MTMSNKMIVVPEGMLKAALDRMEMPHTEPFRIQVGKALEASVRWLSEHPIVPTKEQWFALNDKLAKSVICHKDGIASEYIWLMQEWQRRMFLASDPPSELSFDTPFGRFVIDSRVPPGEIRLHGWNGPTLMRNIKPELEVPEAVKDLLSEDQAHLTTDSDSYNAKILEAYRRGQRNPK